MATLARRFAPLLLLAAASCAAPVRALDPAPATLRPDASADAPAAMEDRVRRFDADRNAVQAFYSSGWCEADLDARGAFLDDQLGRVLALDLSGATPAEAVDAVLLRNEIRGDLSRLKLTRRQLAEMSDLLAVRRVVGPLDAQRRRLSRPDPRAAAKALSAIPSVVTSSRAGADRAEPKLSPATALRAAVGLDGVNRSLHDWYDSYSGSDPGFEWWCKAPFEGAQKAIGDFARHLREDVAGVHGKPDDPLVGDPIGREALLDELRNASIALAPEELIEIGRREMEWCTREAKAAAIEMGFPAGGGDWKAAIEKIKLDVAPAGGQAEYVVGVANEATAFVKERNLVTVPPLCEELWRAVMLSPEAQRTLPFAVYFPQAIGIAAPFESMSEEEKSMAMRGNNRRFTRIVVPHELIPGHHLQSFVGARERPYRRVFGTPFFVEGWALYWEMKLWDLGWARGPEDRLGMLFWRMHRCARITVSLKFHLGEMSPQEMIDYLVENVGHERANATAEVRRYIGGDYGPLYQCGYMIGGKQLRALHAEMVPASLTEKAFNDAVLAAGPIPIELLRAQLRGIAPTLKGEAEWRFETVADPSR